MITHDAPGKRLETSHHRDHGSFINPATTANGDYRQVGGLVSHGIRRLILLMACVRHGLGSNRERRRKPGGV